MEQLLGFRVTERENDAVLIRAGKWEVSPGNFKQSVRPATREEVAMFLRILGFVATVGQLTEAANEATAIINRLSAHVVSQEAAIALVTQANRKIGKERDALKEQLDEAHEVTEQIYARLGDAEANLREFAKEVAEEAKEGKHHG